MSQIKKTILITGTSRGIGLELVKFFAEHNCQVIAVSRKKSELFSEYKNVTFISTDLSKEASIKTLEKNLKQNFKTIDVVIHNAGAIVNKPFSDISQKEWQYIYQVNVFGVALLNQIVLPMMSSGGHVVTISSMGGIQGSLKFAGLSAYSSSKAAVITLSEVLAEEYKNQGISFNVLALGAVQTEMLQEAFPGYQAPVVPEDMAQYIYEFALTGMKFYNAKVLQVSLSTP